MITECTFLNARSIAPSSGTVWRALGARLWSALGIVREPGLWVLMGAMLVCGGLAYRAPFLFALDVGGGSPTSDGCYASKIYDLPYLRGFNIAPEFDVPPERCAAATRAYRWAFDDASIQLRGIGRSSMLFKLVVVGQPRPEAVTSAWQLDEEPLAAVSIAPHPRTYHLLLPPNASSDLNLRFQTLAFQSLPDPRPLAFAVDRMEVATLGSTMPAWPLLSALGLVVGLAYHRLRRWAAPMYVAALVCSLLVVLLAALLVWQRLALTMFVPRLVVLGALGYGLSVVLEPLTSGFAARLGIAAPKREVQLVVGLFVLAWLIRALGLFHPQTYHSDRGLHENNLRGVTRGDIIFTEPLPAEAGGGDAPYPPGGYITLAPLQLLGLSPEHVLVAGNALADSLAVVWLWLLLKFVGAGSRAGLLAGVLYLFARPLLLMMSVGELANVWGQVLILPWILTLVLWQGGRAHPLLLGTVTAWVLLGHSGVFLSLALFSGTLGLLWLLQRHPLVWRLAATLGLTLLLVVGGYYTAFIDEVVGRPSPPPPTTTFAQRLGFELSELTRWNGQLGPLLTLLGIAGVGLAWQRNRRLAQLLLVWWLATLGSWATLLTSAQTLRWEAFVFPALVLGGAYVLNALWRHGQLGQWLTTGIVTSVLVMGCIQWITRLATYNH